MEKKTTPAPTLFSREFWIEYELNKVHAPARRAFLRRRFSGDDGWEKLVTLKRTGKGADEFRTGEWPASIRKYSKAELELKRRPCVYDCGNTLPPKFTPWGELFEDFIPICPRCLSKIKNNKTMENQNTQNSSAVMAEVSTSTAEAAVALPSGVTVEEMLAQWPNLKDATKIRLAERIIHETRQRLSKERAELEAKIKDINSQLGEDAPAVTAAQKRKPGRPSKKNREQVSE